MQQLGRVLDPEELDRADGTRGRLDVDVPEGWIAAGDTVEIIVPSRLTCARCEGGGCDECDRSGAIRLIGDEPARTLRLDLPGTRQAPVRLRLVRPLGEDAGLEQLWLELRAAPDASACCRRIPPQGASRMPWLVFLLVVVALAVTGWCARR